jgi:hypothetical protein
MAIIIKGHHNTPGNIENTRVKEPAQANLEAVRLHAMNIAPKKVKEVNTTLIDYKQSSFISDMLQSNKD